MSRNKREEGALGHTELYGVQARVIVAFRNRMAHYEPCERSD
jgi:hypothetical protein